MASYIERVLDFLEKVAANENTPKTLVEDVEWAMDLI